MLCRVGLTLAGVTAVDCSTCVDLVHGGYVHGFENTDVDHIAVAVRYAAVLMTLCLYRHVQMRDRKSQADRLCRLTIEFI